MLKLGNHDFLQRVIGQSRPFHLLLPDPRPPQVLNLTAHVRGVRLRLVLERLRVEIHRGFFFASALVGDVLLDRVEFVVKPLKQIQKLPIDTLFELCRELWVHIV